MDLWRCCQSGNGIFSQAWFIASLGLLESKVEPEKKNIMSEIKLACAVVEQVEAICDKHRNDPGELINILHECQHLHGYLPEDMQRVDEALGVSMGLLPQPHEPRSTVF